MDTKIKATVYAAKLRKRLAELKAQREKNLADYKTNVDAWRKDMAKWLIANAKQKVDAISSANLKKERNSYYSGPGFDTGDFFKGAPAVPTYPRDKQIRDIQNLLRHLGITGQETVNVSTSDVARYLGEEEGEE